MWGGEEEEETLHPFEVRATFLHVFPERRRRRLIENRRACRNSQKCPIYDRFYGNGTRRRRRPCGAEGRQGRKEELQEHQRTQVAPESQIPHLPRYSIKQGGFLPNEGGRQGQECAIVTTSVNDVIFA